MHTVWCVNKELVGRGCFHVIEADLSFEHELTLVFDVMPHRFVHIVCWLLESVLILHANKTCLNSK